MLKRFASLALALITTTSLFAQEASDLEKRLRDLEAKVAQMQDAAELKRQIEILGQEIEALKTRQSERVITADTEQYGLGAAASKVYRAEPGVAIGGYGEFIYQNSEGEAATADSLRGVIYTGYKFNDRVLFNSELEVEHANLERGGNVEMEFAYLDYLVKPSFNVRTGLVLIPVGLTNEQHEPTAFLGASRPVVEQHIIPTTWSDLGAGVFGEVGRTSYRAFVVTGLDAHGFGAEEGIREGRQAGGEAIAEDLAFVARADFHPFEGTMFGGSIYTGNSGQAEDFSGRVTLGELHADAKFRGVSLRALVARGSLGDAARINEANGLTGDESVGKSFGGWYVEGGYDISSVLPRQEMSLMPYARYERLDTQRRVPAGFLRNPENEQSILTLGFAFKPIAQTVIKIDWQNVDNEANTGRNQWNIALGYIF
ncbi:MAG TPA: hypothetical protein VJZ00_21460 [Thermoanaerobaculia bacterium]|nr:hypothetical protein [Thermoanaerobaculia bacterium]